MAKRGTAAVTPRLRFPEFLDAPEWSEKSLVEVCERITQGGTPDTSNLEYWDGDINWLTPAEMGKSDSPFIASTARKITSAGLDNCSSALLPLTSVIISTRAPIGHLAINSVPTAINQGCKGLVPGAQLDHGFLFSSLSKAKSRLVDLGAGNTFKELSGSALKSFQIPVPSLAEQQKIADCLTSLDRVIAAQGRKVEALKAHKRGLMQQLFPREGETRPRLRFPKFRNAPGWKLQSLDGFIEEFREKSKLQDEYEVLTSARAGLIRQRDYYDNDRIIERGNIGFNVIPPNYMTYRSRSDDRRFYFNENNLGITGIISTYYPVFRIREGSNKFFIELLSQHAELVGKVSVGTSQTVLSLNELRRIKLPIPSSAEQQLVAGSLASIDTQIAAESNQLVALKTHKQGLMQQLFPAPEAGDA